MTTNNKGFTLIELLVVIAIIGILAGILFVAINPKAQTDKASDAKVKAQLDQVRTQAAIVYSNEADPATGYDNVCGDASVTRLSDHCVDSPTAWVADVTLISDSSVWCADSTGFTGVPTNYTPGTSTKCTN